MIDFLQKLQANNIRIKLVEGKLKLISSTKIDDSFVEEIRQKKNELISFLQQQEGGGHLIKEIPRLPVMDKYPLSHAQSRLWVLCQFENSSAAYNIPSALIFHNAVDIILLEKAIKKVINKYEILRTAFREDAEGNVWQYILPPHQVPFGIAYNDISGVSDKEELAKKAALEAGILHFDLKNPPLFNARIFKLEEKRYLFCFTIHHIISDGWSMNILIREIIKNYKAETEQSSREEIQGLLQYRDYSAWHNELLHSGKMKEHRSFWMQEFSDSVPVINIPAEKLRPPVKTFNGEQVRTVFEKKLLDQLYEYTKTNGGTLYTVLLSSVYSLLYKYTGQTDMVFATPVAGREHPDLSDQIGLFINTIPLRLKCNEEDSFNSAFNKIKEQSFNCFKHQTYPFDQLVEDLKLKRDLSRNALFDMMIVLQNTETGNSGEETSILKMEEYPISRSTSQVDINFIFRETGDGLSLLLTYNSDIYSGEMATQMLTHLRSLFIQIVASPELPLKKISLPDADEKKKITEDFNDTKHPYSHTDTLVSIFERQVQKTPENVAITDSKGSVNYFGLNADANRLAHLLSSFPKGKSSYICVHSNRHRYMIEGVYGILKSGAAYLPIEPYIPEARKMMLLEKLGVETILTDLENIADVIALSAKLPCLKNIICLNALSDTDLDIYIKQVLPQTVLYSRASLNQQPSENLNRDINPDDLAYVIFTSGSTGVPKGVVVQHKPVINIIEWVNRTFNINENDKLLFVTSLSFDLSVYDIFGMLATGGSIRIATHDDLKNPEGLVDIIFNEKVTFWDSAPAALHQLVPFIKAKADINREKTLRLAFMSGDWVPLRISDDLKSCFPLIEVISLGGATEATIWSNWYKIEDINPNWTSIPYGKPIQNAKYYVLDEFLNPCPIGVSGDLYIGGEVLALRYEADIELTNRKFIASPFDKNERIYLTGDRARYFWDGNLEFLGRLDDQVKVRGYRIELGEIEHVLQNYPGVKRSVLKVIKGNSGQNELVGYVVSDDVLNSKELRLYLQQHLPEYMIPGYFVQIESVPLTSNGKVDKRNLPDPEESEMDSGVEYVAPANETEGVIAGMWTELLKREKIGVTEDFFESGGHSLLANSLLSKLRKQFSVTLGLRDIFNHTTIRRQAQLIGQATGAKYMQITNATSAESYPLSSSQRRLWILSQFAEGNTAYNMPGVFELEGDLNVERLEQAFRLLTARHEILRTVFKTDASDEIRQFIIPESEFDFSILHNDLRGNVAAEKLLKSFVQAEINMAFDLSRGPLLRACLYRLSDEKYVLCYVMHHIISDGWSMNVLITDLLAIYNSLNDNVTIELKSLSVQYKDYAVWQQSQLNSPSYKEDKAYWLNQFRGSLPVLQIVTDKVRPALKTYNGNIIKGTLDTLQSEKLKSLCKEEGCTLFMGLLAAVNVLMYRYTGQEDIVIGSPIAGREHAEMENQIGLYLNTLAFRNRFNVNENFIKLLKTVKETSLGAYEHQSYPFDELVDNLQLQRDMSRSALFDVMVSLQKSAEHDISTLGDIKIKRYESAENVFGKFDLSFDFIEDNDDIRMTVEYNTDLFYPETIERIYKHFKVLLNSILSAPANALNQFEVISAEEEEIILSPFNKLPEPDDRTITALFEAEVLVSPSVPALVFKNTALTYQQLNERSNRLADYLRKKYDVQPDDLIGILLDRSEWLVISVLGILKSGAAYVPVDPNYPQERIDYMIADSKCKLVIGEEELNIFKQEEEKYCAENLHANHLPENLAYVIYTSGSTGLPKGVMVEHRNVVSIAAGWKTGYRLDEITISLLQMASISFDVFVGDICRSLLAGGTMVVCPADVKLDPENLYELMKQHRISILEGTPGILLPLMTYIQDQNLSVDFLKLLIFGSDTLSSVSYYELQKKLGDRVRIVNSYGTTETTIDSTYFEQRSSENITITTPIGKPFSNSALLIINADGLLQPTGLEGEICIGGLGVARGYLNKPELTSEKFILNPFNLKGKIYRTGDIGRRLSDGNIEFTGRKDDQVKIRGYRVELGEIENVLRACEPIEECVAIVKIAADGDKTIAAYFTAKEELENEKLKAFLLQKLPAYMLPSYFVQLQKMPLTANGKIDRRALPDPELAAFISMEPYIAPVSEIEIKLAEIWAAVLMINKDQVGIKNNFFELGGHSLKAIQIMLRINREFRIRLKIENIFILQTIEEQAMYIGKWQKNNVNVPSEKQEIIPVAPIADSYPLSSAQRRLWILSQFEEGSAAYHIPGVYSIAGKLDADLLEKAFRVLIERHEVLRTVVDDNEEGELMQYIKNADDLAFRFAITDLRATDSREVELRTLVNKVITKHFDLASGPLLRVNLFQMESNKWVLVFVMHHIITDGWSMDIFIKELLMVYKSLIDGNGISLPPIRIQYKDYAVWQQANLHEGKLLKDEAFWKELLCEPLPVIQLFADKKRPDKKTFNGSLIKKRLKGEIIDALRREGMQQESTLFMSLFTVVNILIFKYTGQDDLVIGTPVAGRNHLDLENQIGLFINTLALRTKLKGEQSFFDVLANVKKQTLNAYEHQSYPFDELVEKLNIRRDINRNALFDIMVSFQNVEVKIQEQTGINGIVIDAYEGLKSTGSKLDLTIDFAEDSEGIVTMIIEYNTDLYHNETIEKLAEHYEQLLEALLLEPELPLNEFSGFSIEELKPSKQVAFSGQGLLNDFEL